jgi:hypothetical protein
MSVRTAPSALACIAAMSLVACSALQIDVDVYQGSLNHEPTVQVRQFAAMAIAAKPVLATLRNRLHDDAYQQKKEAAGPLTLPAACRPNARASASDAKQTFQDLLRSLNAPQKNDSAWNEPRFTGIAIPVGELNKYSHTVQFEGASSGPGASSRAAAFYLNGLLSFYEASHCVHPADDWDRARSPVGLIDLFQTLLKTEHGDEDNKKALDELVSSLILFAERILFVVNNPGLFSDGKYQTERAILQTLGNSLLLHANDLRRREKHEENQEQRFDAQRRAAENATAPTAPGAVLQDIARIADASRKKAEAADRAASAAVVTAAKRKVDTKAQADQAAAAAKAAEDALKKWRNPNPGIERVYATLVMPGSAKDAAAALQDHGAVNDIAQKLKPDGIVSVRELSNEILAWAAKERDAARKGGERQLRLSALARALDAKEPTLPVRPIVAGAALSVLSQLQRQVQEEFDRSVTEEKMLQAKLDAAKVTHGQAVLASDAAVKADIAAQEAARTAKGALDVAADTAKMVADALPRSLGAIGSTDRMHPEAVRQVVLAQLQLPVGNTNAASLTLARDAVKAMTLVSGFDFSAGRYSDKDAKLKRTSIQVLDDLIAHLQTMRVKALAEGNPAEARQLGEAAALAEQQRVDQVFLRPSADYLRNVYSNTSLQNNDREPSRNMLADYLRALAPRRTTSSDDPGEQGARSARRELEKLFWQNINRVTTSGGTRTNYVIAKDDVGNWYIKSYSVDPKEVFESAKGLALFNKGDKLDTNLLRRAELRDAVRTGSEADRQAARAELSTMDARSPAALEFGGRAQRRFELRYAEETQEAASALKARVVDLPTKTLPNAWGVHLKADTEPKHKELLTTLQAAAATRQNGSLSESVSAMEGVIARIGDGQTHPSKLGLAIVDVLHMTTRYRDDLSSILAANDYLKDPAQSDLLKTLQSATKKSVDAVIDDVAQKRRRSVESYQEGLASIADVVK